MNSITDKFWYTDEESKNMRLLISTLSEKPSAWRVSKCENIQPFGIQKLTIYSNFFNEHTDYVNLETGEMYADYFDSEITPTDPSIPTITSSPITSKISASTSTIKVGGSYKTLTINLYNDSNEDITSEYPDVTISWSCNIDNEDWTNKVVWRSGTNFNQKKLKFPMDASMIGKILTIQCTVKNKDNLITKSEPLRLELIE